MDADLLGAVVDAVAAGAVAGAKDTAASAVKTSYQGLKALLVRRRIDVAAVEQRPDSSARRDSLREDLVELDGTPDAVDAELVAAARRVIDAVADNDAGAAAVVGVDLARVRTAFLRIRDIDSAGTGVRVTDAEVAEGIDIHGVRAGGDPPRRDAVDPPRR